MSDDEERGLGPGSRGLDPDPATFLSVPPEVSARLAAQIEPPAQRPLQITFQQQYTIVDPPGPSAEASLSGQLQRIEQLQSEDSGRRGDETNLVRVYEGVDLAELDREPVTPRRVVPPPATARAQLPPDTARATLNRGIVVEVPPQEPPNRAPWVAAILPDSDELADGTADRPNSYQIVNRALLDGGLRPLVDPNVALTTFELTRPRGFNPMHDPETGDVLGYRRESDGYFEVVDRTGKVVRRGESQIESFAKDYFDLAEDVTDVVGYVDGAKLALSAGKLAWSGVKLLGKLAADGGPGLLKGAAAAPLLAGATAGQKAIATQATHAGHTAERGIVNRLLGPGAHGVTKAERAAALRDAMRAAVFQIQPNAGELLWIEHRIAREVRKAMKGELGDLAAMFESAHIVPQAVGKRIKGYRPGNALTTMLPKDLHAALDAGWKNQWEALKKLSTATGRPVRAFDVESMITEAIDGLGTRLPKASKDVLKERLVKELYGTSGAGLGLTRDSVVFP